MGIASEFALSREQAGLTVEEAAGHTGFTVRTIRRWENGNAKPRKAALELMRRLATEASPRKTRSGDFAFIDLFAGIGGMRRGFESIGGECVFTSEWNEYSRKTYQANFQSDHPINGDITQIEAAGIPKHDVLLAGFPCQPFSIAGVSKKNSLGRPHGFRCETQGTLFFDVARIIDHHRPAAFLLENVKNLKNHDKGKTFSIIRSTLEDELGYQVDVRVQDARPWVPQHRERIFIAGFRKDVGFTFDDLPIPLPEMWPRLGQILHPEDGTEESEERFTTGRKAQVDGKYTLSEKLWQYLQNYAAKHRARGNGFGFGLVGRSDVARTLSARYYKDGAEILIERGAGQRPRRLTPRECSRLMGFDLPRGSEFVIPVSDSQAYRQFGNSVAVPVVKAVATLMKPCIMKAINWQQQRTLFTS
ncbi:MAG: DNA (cytosine-5-)-methyltransferase [Planctomycetota bacterium]|nr:DNA (cytosine-5-)-methyltransferase [Planctomycetota bacterium]